MWRNKVKCETDLNIAHFTPRKLFSETDVPVVRVATFLWHASVLLRLGSVHAFFLCTLNAFFSAPVRSPLSHGRLCCVRNARTVCATFSLCRLRSAKRALRFALPSSTTDLRRFAFRIRSCRQVRSLSVTCFDCLYNSSFVMLENSGNTHNNAFGTFKFQGEVCCLVPIFCPE